MTDGLLALTTMTASGDLSCGCDALASGESAPALTPAPDPVMPAQNADPSALGTSAFWAGCIGMEGQLTGDGRFIETNALTWALPMPLRYVSSDVGEHGGAQVAGRILQVERKPGGVIWATGDYDLESPIGMEAERQVRQNLTNGISMDLDDVSFEVRVAAELLESLSGPDATPLDIVRAAPNADGTVTVATIKSSDEVRATLSARIRAATIVAIPAFADAKIYSTDAAPMVAGPPVTDGTLPTDQLAAAPPTPPADQAASMDGLMPDGQTPCSCTEGEPGYDPLCVRVQDHEDPQNPSPDSGKAPWPPKKGMAADPFPPKPAKAGPKGPKLDGLMPDGVTKCSTDPNGDNYDPKCVVPKAAAPQGKSAPVKGKNPFPPKPGMAAYLPPVALLAELAANPKNVDSERKLISWYEHGEGAAKIRWGTPGDFDRCRKIAGQHMPPDETSGFCANRHHAVTGEWPGKDAHKGGKHETITAAALALAYPLAPPSGWFDNPFFKMASPMTVTQEGRLFGHLAAWGVCHIGMSHQGCVTAPKSRSGYAYFHTGSIVTAENAEIPVGHITLDTTHAPTTGLSAAGAQNHYERTGHVVADVVAGEDAFGIWVSGALRPGVSAAQVRELRAAPLSGDWRRVSGSLELVAALAVNVPGFPIPRPKGLVAGGVVQSLVASGMVPPRQVISPGQPGSLSLDDLRYLKRLADRERAEEATLLAAGTLPSATDLARRVRASALAMRAHSTKPKG